ncbi:transcriptional regulator [Weissella koreensis KACC 15510]|uniref:MerR family transcriptional regulator n=1 Tax=Weissella koreensis TaxID=165096 RepID=UPI00021758B7|nr:MerR family transcriptional regulator [Weissella koreensis]AEJ23562.1 transcriptional regulator [Weissella koreensis KACC 15510]
MSYTISQVAKAMQIPASTLRYYDKEGLLPNLSRQASGYRSFSDGDIEMIDVIECLKATGMSINDIKNYADLTKSGDNSLEARRDMFIQQKALVKRQIASLENSMQLLDKKCQYYESAIEAGTETIHFPIQMSLQNRLKFQK